MKYRYFKKYKQPIISIFIIAGLLIFLTIQLSSQKVLSETKLKNLAAPDTKIGSVGTYNTFFPADGQSQQKYRTLYRTHLRSL